MHNRFVDKIEYEIAEASFAIGKAVERAEPHLEEVRERSAELGAELEALLGRLREDGRSLTGVASRWHYLE